MIMQVRLNTSLLLTSMDARIDQFVRGFRSLVFITYYYYFEERVVCFKKGQAKKGGGLIGQYIPLHPFASRPAFLLHALPTFFPF